MRRSCIALLAWLVLAAAVHAHFIWIVPREAGGAKPTVVDVLFSENLKADSPELLKKIAGTKFFAQVGNRVVNVENKWTGEGAFQLALPEGGCSAVYGVCRYGVLQRGDSGPFLLMYYPKAILAHPVDKVEAAKSNAAPENQTPLEIVPIKGKAGTFQVLWRDQPLLAVSVTVHKPGDDKGIAIPVDVDGMFAIEETKAPAGTYGMRVNYVDNEEGKFEGKSYKESRHYATLVVSYPSAGAEKGPAGASLRNEQDIEATKLLAEARAARASWEGFPGFSADIEVAADGKLAKGRVNVDLKGKVHLELGDSSLTPWAKATLSSIVGHRRAAPESAPTPCAFVDADTHNPLGRAIRVLDDEFHSSYRVRDRQIIVVNRNMQDARFSITVMENQQNEEKQFLPACFTVSTWDLKTDALRSSETQHQTWRRVDRFDLPDTTTVVTARPGKPTGYTLNKGAHPEPTFEPDGQAVAGRLEARTLKLSNHQLGGS